MAGNSVGGPELPPAANLVAKTFEDGGKHFTAVSITFWLTCLYVLITVSSTDHQELLLGDTPKLPLLDVSISLKAFFIVAPLLVLVLHLHLLLQNHVLVWRLQHRRVRDLQGDEGFFLFPSLPVLREVLAPLEPFVAKLVWLSLWITNVLLPLSVFCVTQGIFLPYHSTWITLLHQICIIVDLVIAWCFLVVLFPSRERQGRWWTTLRLIGGVVTVLVLVYAFILAVVPGTWVEILTGKHRLAGLVPRNLILNPNKEGANLEGAFLVGRDLRGADFEGAVLAKADLRGADLRGAILENADLQGANLNPLGVDSPILTQERGVQKVKDIEDEITRGEFKPTWLSTAKLKNANLEGASLILANLSGADLRKAHLRGVELTGARLRRTQLGEADLAGSEFSLARMEGADLTGAHAEGATFDHASLSGASLNQVNAPAASFVSTNLEGARLTEAVLKAANFYGATLAGSDFRWASLQGSSSLRLEAMDLRGAHLGGICRTSALGLTDFRSVDLAFLSPEEWSRLKLEVRGRLGGRSEEETNSVLGRIEEAAGRVNATPAQLVCLGTLLSSPRAQRSLGFLKLDNVQNVIVEAEPEASEWTEAAFHKELAGDLLARACYSEGLALTVKLRAAGEYVPGDHDLDLELAKQLLVKLRDPSCRELQNFPPRLKQQIAWRLRKQARAEEERRP